MDFISTMALFSVAFVASAAIIPFVIHFARKKGLMEENNDRKIHKEKVSNLGGTGIFAGCALAVFFILQPGAGNPVLAFALAFPLFLVGLLDDVFNVGVMTRLVMQTVLAAVLFEMGFQFVLIENLTYWFVNLGATIFLIIVLINAYNFIDGINGLAGGLGMIGSLVFGAMLAVNGEAEIALLCFAYAGSLLGFLCFNFGKKAKIFMGDNGSTVLGFFMAVMILAILKTEQSQAGSAATLPVLLCLVAVPAADIFKVALFRIVRNESPFQPDRTHIHHLLTDRGLSHPAACAVLYGWTMVSTAIVFYLPDVLKWQFAAAATAVPYLLAAGLSQVKGLKPAISSLPAQDTPPLHNLQAN